MSLQETQNKIWMPRGDSPLQIAKKHKTRYGCPEVTVRFKLQEEIDPPMKVLYLNSPCSLFGLGTKTQIRGFERGLKHQEVGLFLFLSVERESYADVFVVELSAHHRLW